MLYSLFMVHNISVVCYIRVYDTQYKWFEMFIVYDTQYNCSMLYSCYDTQYKCSVVLSFLWYTI